MYGGVRRQYLLRIEILLDGWFCIYIMRTSSAAAGFSGDAGG